MTGSHWLLGVSDWGVIHSYDTVTTLQEMQFRELWLCSCGEKDDAEIIVQAGGHYL